MVSKSLMDELEQLGIGSDINYIMKYLRDIQNEAEMSNRKCSDIDSRYTRVVELAKELDIETSNKKEDIREITAYEDLSIIKDILGDKPYSMDFVLIPDGVDIEVDYSNGYISRARITGNNKDIGEYIVKLLGCKNEAFSKYRHIRVSGRLTTYNKDGNILGKKSSLNDTLSDIIRLETISDEIVFVAYRIKCIGDNEADNDVLSKTGFITADHKEMQFVVSDILETTLDYIDRYFKDNGIYDKLRYITMRIFTDNEDINNEISSININLGDTLGYIECRAKIEDISWKYSSIYLVPVIHIRYLDGKDKGGVGEVELGSINELDGLCDDKNIKETVRVRYNKSGIKVSNLDN